MICCRLHFPSSFLPHFECIGLCTIIVLRTLCSTYLKVLSHWLCWRINSAYWHMELKKAIWTTVQNTVTASGHGRVKNVGNQGLLRGPEVDRRLAGFRALATMKDQPKRGKGLDPDREKTCDWSRQGGRFTAKKNESQKVSSKLRQGRERSPFHVGPVEGEILVTEWPNRSRQFRWVRNWGST